MVAQQIPAAQKCTAPFWRRHYGLTKTLFTCVSRTRPPCAIFEQSNLVCGGYGLRTTPDGSCGSLSPVGYLPFRAGYFLAASCGVMGVATMEPPAPSGLPGPKEELPPVGGL